MAYAAMKPTKPGLEEPQEQNHKIRITLSSENVKNLEKELEMSFDPSKLENVYEAKDLELKASPLSKGKKRAREAAPRIVSKGAGQTSRTKSPIPPPRPTPRSQARPPTPRGTPKFVDLDDDVIPQSLMEEYVECSLVSSIVNKYKEEVCLHEGIKTLEIMILKTLSIARGLALKGLNTSSKLDELKMENEQNKKWVFELEGVLDMAMVEAKNARDQIGAAKNEAEEAKLELMHAKKGFEDELAKARAQAVEDFKKSEEFQTLLGEYGLGSYHYGLRLARSFLRTKLPEDLKPLVLDLKSINLLANELELSASEVEDEDDDEAGTPDQGDPVNATDLDQA